jgi:hypothetical protein
MITACGDALSAPALRGLEEFNRGEYFEAHEYLEIAWREDGSPGRTLYQAVLQVAVMYYQIQRGNYRGAVKMFRRAQRWIALLPDTCRGVDVARLRGEAEAAFRALTALGEARIREFDRRHFLPVHYTER